MLLILKVNVALLSLLDKLVDDYWFLVWNSGVEQNAPEFRQLVWEQTSMPLLEHADVVTVLAPVVS